MNKKFLFLIISILLLAGCSPNPVKEAQAYQIQTQADQDALNSQLSRSIANQNQAWTEEKRDEKMDLWMSVEPVAKAVSKVAAFVIIISVSLSLSFAAWKTSQAYAEFVTIRARIVPLDRQTGVRPQFLWPASQKSLPDSNGIFDKFKSAVHVHDTRWMLIDSSTGEHHPVDEKKKADDIQIEVHRQLILAWQVSNQQRLTASSSPDGHVAEAIGHGSIDIPDAGNKIIDFSRAKALLVDEALCEFGTKNLDGENSEY